MWNNKCNYEINKIKEFVKKIIDNIKNLNNISILSKNIINTGEIVQKKREHNSNREKYFKFCFPETTYDILGCNTINEIENNDFMVNSTWISPSFSSDQDQQFICFVLDKFFELSYECIKKFLLVKNYGENCIHKKNNNLIEYSCKNLLNLLNRKKNNIKEENLNFNFFSLFCENSLNLFFPSFSDNIISNNTFSNNSIQNNIVQDNIVRDNTILDNIVRDNIVPENNVSDNLSVDENSEINFDNNINLFLTNQKRKNLNDIEENLNDIEKNSIPLNLEDPKIAPLNSTL
jgi:hypothetical protein